MRNAADHLVLRFGHLPHHAIQQQLTVSHHGGDGSSQVVTHGGEELVAAGLLFPQTPDLDFRRNARVHFAGHLRHQHRHAPFGDARAKLQAAPGLAVFDSDQLRLRTLRLGSRASTGDHSRPPLRLRQLELRQRCANGFIARNPEHCLCPRVPEGDAPVVVYAEHGTRQRTEHVRRVQPLLRLCVVARTDHGKRQGTGLPKPGHARRIPPVECA